MSQIPYKTLELQSPCSLGAGTLAGKARSMFNTLNIKFINALIEIFTQCDGNQERWHYIQITESRQDLKNR